MKKMYERKYKFILRTLGGLEEYVVKGKDVSAAVDNLAEELDMSTTELCAITEEEKTQIWNPTDEVWVKSRPWWEEDKEPYKWETL